MNSKYNWNLTEFFENEEALDESIKELYNKLEKVKQFKGKLAHSVDELFGCYKTLEKALE